jgi:DNA-binding beta-propeller fold protein YncE
MKKILKKFSIILLTLSLIIIGLSGTNKIKAEDVPYRTVTIEKGGREIYTQNGYYPVGGIIDNLEIDGKNINKPEDIFIKNHQIYLADTLNNRVLVYDLDGNYIKEYNNLNNPTGIFVDDNENLYVCLPKSEKVVKLDKDGIILKEYNRPVEPIFGKNSPYVPLKIIVDLRGNLFINGEGSVSGLIQLAQNGSFLGFFGANYSSTSFFQMIIKIFDAGYAKNLPVSPTDLTVDSKGSIYTANSKNGLIKKFNISSEEILKYQVVYSNNDTPIAITTSSLYDIYVLTKSGSIIEHDSLGNPFFIFNIADRLSTGRLGLVSSPADIEVDDNNNLYVLDKTTGQIFMYSPSNFANLVHDGLKKSIDGIYEETVWQEILRLNSFFSLANSAIGQVNYRQKNYDQAMLYYERANDKTGYSLAFWQVRYEIIQNLFGPLLLGVVFLFVALKVLKKVDKKYLIYEPLRKFKTKVMSYKIVEEIAFTKEVVRHPMESFLDIKQIRKTSLKGAFVLLIIAFVFMTIKSVFTAYLFNTTNIERFNVFSEIVIFSAVVFLFVLSNYLISTITDGEGNFKQIFIGLCYALTPIIILSLPITLVSYFLTLNEQFIFSFLNIIMYVWSGLLVISMIKETHNFNVFELIKNILLTIFIALIIVLVLFIVYLLTGQLIDFISSIIKEIRYRG